MAAEKRIEILILTHGWVIVGVVTDDGRESGEAEVAYAHTIVRWGTTDGIAQLCREGPRRETRLNPAIPSGDLLRINRTAVIARLACDSSKWSERLGVE